MKLVVAEKPSVMRDIAAVLAQRKRPPMERFAATDT